MTATQKEAIKEMRYKQMSYAQIADHLCLSVNTVKSYCFRNGLNPEALNATHSRCQYCGKLITSPLKTRPRKFCCEQCKITWWNRHRRDRRNINVRDYTCVVCGKTFSDYTSVGRKYCSRTCYENRGGVND